MQYYYNQQFIDSQPVYNQKYNKQKINQCESES